MTVVAERADHVAANDTTKRITLDLPAAMHKKLSAGRLQDGITMAERLRALVSLWTEDEELRDRVTTRARQLAIEQSQQEE